MDLYISPEGKDSWSGLLSAPAADGSDGPLASFTGARDRLRQLKNGTYNPRWGTVDERLDGPVTVHVHGGVYPIAAPMTFGPEDSYPVTFRACEGEQPIVDGGVRITDWTTGEVNGHPCWIADLPEVKAGNWNFRQLFVSDRRASRPRLPKAGLMRMEEAPDMPPSAGWGIGGYTRFVAAEGDVESFRNLNEVEVVYLHFWIEERSPILSFDPDSRMVTMTRPSRAPLVGSHGSQLADYYLDNLFEALSEPGEWYLDRGEGKLYYLPREGETPEETEVWAPRCLQLLAIIGDPDQNRLAEHIRFEGITFRHTDWRHPDEVDEPTFGSWRVKPGYPGDRSFGKRHARAGQAAAAQAACDIPGVITFEGARHCAIERCTVEQVGWYGIDIGDGCQNIQIVGNAIRDLGAGGVKINGAAASDPDVARRRTGLCQIADNEISAAGRIFHSGVGVLSMNAFQMAIVHNHIHDLFYTGVSCGWEWGYHPNVSRDNLIAWNHIHDIGQGLLSDMGGIYTLGVQPGTVLRGNLIHDVHSAHYGGWCIYPDEGSSHILIEHNICYDADRNAFHQHYGRENVIRNNIFAFGGEAVCTYSRKEPHRGFTFMRNILVTSGLPLWNRAQSEDNGSLAPEKERILCDLNLFFDTDAAEPTIESRDKTFTLAAWREAGLDLHSLVADPGFADLEKRDFSLAADSQAFTLGFEPIDLSQVGPR
jgi:hypothetical protein